MSQFHCNAIRLPESPYNSAQDHYMLNKWLGLRFEETKPPQSFRAFKPGIIRSEAFADHFYSPPILARVFDALQRVGALRGRPNNDGLDKDYNISQSIAHQPWPLSRPIHTEWRRATSCLSVLLHIFWMQEFA